MTHLQFRFYFVVLNIVHGTTLFKHDANLKFGIILQNGVELPHVLMEGYQTSKCLELEYHGKVFCQNSLLNPDETCNSCLSRDFLRTKYPFCPSLKTFLYES
jgi:hypothetical protein